MPTMMPLMDKDTVRYITQNITPEETEYVCGYAKNLNKVGYWFEKYEDEYIKRYKEEDEQGKYFWDTNNNNMYRVR